MNPKVTDFPQYRMLSNGKSFYKINDSRNFEEIQIIGSRKIKHTIEAKQYPEILKIQDLLNQKENQFVVISEVEWNKQLSFL